MIKKAIVFLALLMVMVIGVSAGTVTLSSLGTLNNATMKDSSTINYNFKVAGNQSTWSCTLYGNEYGSTGTGTWRAIETNSAVSNNTNTSFTSRIDVKDSTGFVYNWNVRCSGTTHSAIYAAKNYTFGVDTVDPSITATPAASSWSKQAVNGIQVTVVDNNPNTCILTSSINVTGNTTTTGPRTYAAVAYVNNTAKNLTVFNLADNNTGAYTYSIACTDDAGNSGTVSTRTFYVDTTAPGAFAFNTSLWLTSANSVAITNNTYSTDYTPQIGWTMPTELNFARYLIQFKNVTSGASIVSKNVTTQSTLYTDMSTLSADIMYRIYVTAYDEAGNSKDMTSTGAYYYGTDSTGHSLLSGWSVLMNTGAAKNLSVYMTHTSATTACILNSSKSFVCQTSGGSYGSTSVAPGMPVFLYLSSASTYSDAVWAKASINQTNYLNNASANGWNIVCNRNYTSSYKTLANIDKSVNGNGTYVKSLNVTRMSYYNWSAPTTKYIPYVANWSINQNTRVAFGECLWMYLDSTQESSKTVNWGAIVG